MGGVNFSDKHSTGKRTGGRCGVQVVCSRRFGTLAMAALLAAFGLGMGVARYDVAQPADGTQLDFDQQQALLEHIGDLSARIVQLEMQASGLAGQMGTLKEFEARMQMDDATVRQGPRARTQPSASPVTAALATPAPEFDLGPAADVVPGCVTESACVGGPFLQDAEDADSVDAKLADHASVAAQSDGGQNGWGDVVAHPAMLSRLPDSLARSLESVHGTLVRLSHALAGLNAHAQTITLAHMAFPGRRPVSPEVSWVSSTFGKRKDPFNTRLAFHSGVDFAANRGTPIHASAGGKVVFAGNRPAYGKTVEIDHGNGLVTRYAHAHKVLVKQGQVVVPGQPVAQVGSTGRSTGTHLHFEIIKDGHFVDPAPYLARF